MYIILMYLKKMPMINSRFLASSSAGLESARNALLSQKRRKKMKFEEEGKVYAYKLRRKSDGSIYLYILGFKHGDNIYYSFPSFYDAFLRLCGGKAVIYSPPPIARDGKEMYVSENLEIVGYSEQEAKRLEEYRERKISFFWR
jgi:hypothetical protein